MKYPYVIIFNSDKSNQHIEQWLIHNSSFLDFTAFFTYDKNQLTIINNPDYNCIISTQHLQKLLAENNYSVKKINNILNKLYIETCVINREFTRPVLSLFTSSFNSGTKLFRVYNSLLLQQFKNWEWVILDDSDNGNNFKFMLNSFSNDSRIRMYKRGKHSGNIGNTKNETIGLCRGKYLLEMDHDDELVANISVDIIDTFEKNPDVGFIYTDCASVYESGENQSYGDFICKGYGGYYRQKYNGFWRNVYITPNINNITLSHLVCCPNHPRVWRKDVLLALGSYCEKLFICDDYEILLRTALSTKIAKIHKLGYIQYTNHNSNNFSLIRNSEINRIGPNYISPIYYEKLQIHDKMKELNAYEDEKYITQCERIWKRGDDYEHKYCNKIVNVNFKKQICIIGIDSLYYFLDEIRELHQIIDNDFIVLDNKGDSNLLCYFLDVLGFSDFKAYCICEATNDELIKYFNLLYLSTEEYVIYDVNQKILPINSNCDRSQVINNMVKELNININTAKYLEIGVENGSTYNSVIIHNKTGVDPSPNGNFQNLIKVTSDEFFEKYVEKNMYDIMFIDGMHQTEYVSRDIDNSLKCITNNGIIFIDDILPMNALEQTKVPHCNFVEEGVLKCKNLPWTGDVWKVIYHLLKKYEKNIIMFKYYNSNCFRGVGAFKMRLFDEVINIDEITGAEMVTYEKINYNLFEDIDEINSYDYFEDYNKYLELVVKLASK